MPNCIQLVQQLRETIGAQVDYQGLRCAVVELLDEPPSLVLQVLGPRTTIQENQFGLPNRRVTQIFTIPCLSEDEGECLHQELLSLGLFHDQTP